jgi:hypothetical protein
MLRVGTVSTIAMQTYRLETCQDFLLHPIFLEIGSYVCNYIINDLAIYLRLENG